MPIRPVDFVTLNGRVGVVFLTAAVLGQDLADHAAVWFGAVVAASPEVWLVPTDVLTPGPEPTFPH